MSRVTDRFQPRVSILGCLALSLLVSLPPSGASAIDLPQNFNFDGVLISSSTGQPMVGPVSIVFQIFDPANTCLVYEEQHSSVTLDSAGAFAVKIGAGTRAASSVDGGLALKQIFRNNGQVRGLEPGCAAGYTPAPGDGRNLRVTVNGTALSPEYALSPVPMATVAETLQGKLPTDFVAAAGAASLTGPVTLSNQGEVRFGSTNSNYVSFQAQPSMASTTAYFWPFSDGANGNCLTTNGAGGLNWSSCMSGGAVAGGDLTGTYPNPTLANTAVTAGTYPKVTVDSKGRVTAGMALTTTDLLPVVLTGDVTGGVASTSVQKIRGVSVSPTTPSDGQILKYNLGMTRWEPSTLADLSAGGTISGALTLTGNLTTAGATSLAALTASGLITANSGLTVSSGTIASPNGSASSPAIKVGVTAGYGLFNTGSALGFSANSAERMRITDSGNVGIGTTSPSFLLHVGSSAGPTQIAQFEGPISIRNNSSGAPTNLTLVNLNGLPNSGTSLELAGLNSGSSIRTAAKISGFLSNQTVGSENGVFSLSTVSSGTLSEKMRIDSAGNVGIGITSPTSKLQVAGDITPDLTASKNLGSSTLRWNNIYLSNAPDVSSDARLKKDVQDSDLGLEFINSLRPVSWTWKDQSQGSTQHYGVIAQEAESAIAKTKGGNSNNVIVTHNEETDSYSVRYTELISPLIKAVQELYNDLLRVKADNAAKDEKINHLEHENAAIKARLEKIEKALQSK